MCVESHNQFALVIPSINLTITFDAPPQPGVSSVHVIGYTLTFLCELGKCSFKLNLINHVAYLARQVTGITFVLPSKGS